MTIQERAPATQLEQNKDVARAVIERIFMHQEDAAIDQLIATDFVPHTFADARRS
jgi:hypothetical protein